MAITNFWMGYGQRGWFGVKKQIKGSNRWGGDRTKWWLAGGFQNGNRQVELESDNALLIDVFWNSLAVRDGNKVTGHLAKVDGDKLDNLVILDDPLHFVIVVIVPTTASASTTKRAKLIAHLDDKVACIDKQSFLDKQIKGGFGWVVGCDAVRLAYFLSHTAVSLQYLISPPPLFLH
ncbi:hypothetical protein Goari_023612 [Gossypium aridum]|uniref:Uncharacterized protein n=1 Tax=Gossypium aridum TaxID=34290 RepID=A0A7J8X4V3_GOSAI|nr:hypothetical protein [Gossypium aridum]